VSGLSELVKTLGAKKGRKGLDKQPKVWGEELMRYSPSESKSAHIHENRRTCDMKGGRKVGVVERPKRVDLLKIIGLCGSE